MIKAIIFDWGDTVMRDFPGCTGPMCDWEHVELIPGIQEALEKLNPRYICFIATSAAESNTEQMRRSLRRVDVEKYFHGFASSRELQAAKPEAEYFLHVADLLQLPLTECVHVGNIYAKDIQPAKALGMRTVYFNEAQTPGSFPDADAVVHHLADLPEIIKTLDNQ